MNDRSWWNTQAYYFLNAFIDNPTPEARARLFDILNQYEQRTHKSAAQGPRVSTVTPTSVGAYAQPGNPVTREDQ